jgi:hypothetical protein
VNAVSPYIERKKLTGKTIENNCSSGLYGAVLPNFCDGHFQDYPALPVAIVGNHNIELGIDLFNHHTANQFNKVISINCTVNAFRLAFSGEDVTFSTKIKQVLSNDRIIFSGEAKVGEEVISNSEFELKGIISIENN